MEKYKVDLVELRDSIYNKHTNNLNYNLLRPSVVLPEHFYSPSISRGSLFSATTDIPTFNKYVLTEEAKEALKTSEFNVWHWEHNEVNQFKNQKDQSNNEYFLAAGPAGVHVL